MLVTDSFANAQEYAERAITIMAQKGIPATPQNYTLWYDYVSDRNPELKIAIDEIIKVDDQFPSDVCNEFYEKFYLSNEQQGRQIQEAGEKIQGTLKQVIQQINEAGSDNASYGKKINSLANHIAGEERSSSLKHFVEEIVRETASITEKNNSLQKQLEQSSNEIDELQQNLEKVKIESLTDALTQIGNRKLFDSQIIKESKLSDDEQTDLCLLLLDIDNFKKFNDTYGHRIGDEVLKVVAGKLKSMVKGQDTPSRYGGEEFTCILPNTQLHDAVKLADHIREKIAKQVLVNKKTGKEFSRITISIGVSKYVNGERLENFVQRADEALYRAKDQGRNRVIEEIS